MTVVNKYKQYWRARREATFDAATPGTANEWNLTATAAQGWQDLPAARENDGLQPGTVKIFPAVASGERGANTAPPVSGAELGELGSLELMGYPDLLGNFLSCLMGGTDVKENAGTAALADGAWGWTGQAITAPTGDEVFKFTFTSGTATSAVIQILEGGSVVETITIPDGVYAGDVYSKGGWGAGGTVTLTSTGAFTANIAVAGVTYFQPAYYFGETAYSLVIEEYGRPEVVNTPTTYSDYYPGIVIPSMNFAFDREAGDGMLTATANILGLNPDAAAQSTYSEDVQEYYTPFAGWTATFLVDDVAWAQVKSMSLDVNGNNELYSVASGAQAATGVSLGSAEAMGTFVVYPVHSATDRWTDYEANTARDIKIKFTSPAALNQTTYGEVQFHFPAAYIETYNRTSAGSTQTADIVLRGISSESVTTPAGASVETAMCITKKGRVPI